MQQNFYNSLEKKKIKNKWAVENAYNRPIKEKMKL